MAIVPDSALGYMEAEVSSAIVKIIIMYLNKKVFSESLSEEKHLG